MTRAFMPYSNPDGTETGLMWRCPGCGEPHSVPTDGHPRGANWTFDGNVDAPTFSPSIRVRGVKADPYTCHFFIRKGIAEFCGDCTGDHAGKKLRVLPDEEGE